MNQRQGATISAAATLHPQALAPNGLRVDRETLETEFLALAERTWSPATTTDWPDFRKRLNAHLPGLGSMGVSYYGMPPDGSWSPKEVTEQYAPNTWNITPKLHHPGKYLVLFSYTGGACRLGIERVDLLANGKVIATDTHRGVTGATSEANRYTLDVKQCEPAAKYEIRASIRSEGGTDSSGSVYFDAVP